MEGQTSVNNLEMVRIIIKGGVWKNTEDEVLKAAIAKYGKNQWARISSLLVRKTPKQCKARWYEWLDPSIKKTEWSNTEDEKLLHLAKLMPTQWRTIAPIVGRTATQCLERYQRLLDEAEAKENEELGLAGPGGEAGPSSEEIRKLRPGEIDPDPETKPARPDPIDMDEDEKEMLSEARARLANTQGKKAKRKARERQLEEARRLAMLQKRRELKAAGIMSGMRAMKKKKGIDYNADIPFEKKPAPGFYDTSEEQARVVEAPVGQSLKRLEAKRKPTDDDTERRKRQKKEDPAHQTKFIAARDAQIQKLKEAEQISKRRKLELPAAQVGEAELEEIVKMGHAGRAAREMVESGNETTGRLLDDQEGLMPQRSLRTPRTAPMEDSIMNEARNLRNMTIQQTPLLGDENTPMRLPADGGTGFDGATPRHHVPVTPNPLATPGGDSMLSGTPFKTPMRDSLRINQEDRYLEVTATPRQKHYVIDQTKRTLRQGFGELPKPENNFELLVPEDENDEGEAKPTMLEDAAERDARERRQREEATRRELARRSMVVQLSLPRPVAIDIDQLMKELSVDEDDKVQKAIDEELVKLMQHDTIAYPLPGTSLPGSTRSIYEHPEDDYMTQARAAVQQELASVLGFPDAREEQVKQGLIAIAKDEDVDERWNWASVKGSLVFDRQTKVWIDAAELDAERRKEGLSFILDEVRDRMTREASRVGKTEKKLGKMLGGYQARSSILSKRVTDTFVELERTQMELESFARLEINEGAAGPRRVQLLEEEIERLERKERGLQMRYGELERERGEVSGRVLFLEERLMAEAEALND